MDKELEKILSFGVVGGIGAIINTLVLFLLTYFAHLHYIASSLLATEIAVITNFIGNNWYTFRDAHVHKTLAEKFFSYQLISIITIFGTASLLFALTNLLGVAYLLIWNIFAIGLMFIINYILNTTITWSDKPQFKFIVFFALLLVPAITVDAQVNASLNTTTNSTDVVILHASENETADGEKDETQTHNELAPINQQNATLENNTTQNSTTQDMVLQNNTTINDAPENATKNTSPVSESQNETTGSEETPKEHVVIHSFTVSVPWDDASQTYLMNELQEGVFDITLDKDTEILWKVNGVVLFTEHGIHSQFRWTPGVYWSPQAPDYALSSQNLLRVEAGDQFREIPLRIKDVLNPFFSSADNGPDIPGSGITRIHVMSNSEVMIFSSMDVMLTTPQGARTSPLQPRVIDTQVDWYVDLSDLPPGTTTLVKLIGVIGNETREFSLDPSRSHFRDWPAPIEDEVEPEEEEEIEDETLPLVISALFENDVVDVNESQILRVDLQYFDVGIEEVSAIIRDPAEERIVLDLLQTDGDFYYGTWGNRFADLIKGRYELESLRVIRLDGEEREVEASASFYAADSASLVKADLSLINVMLSESMVKNGTPVTLIVDAADFDGVVLVSANITGGNGPDLEEMTISLKRVSGDAGYGTWKGTFIPDSPDTTYWVDTVTLMDAGGRVNVSSINGRQVYVKAPPRDLASFAIQQTMEITTWRDALDEMLKMPAFPSVVAFCALLVILMGVQLASKGVGE